MKVIPWYVYDGDGYHLFRTLRTLTTSFLHSLEASEAKLKQPVSTKFQILTLHSA